MAVLVRLASSRNALPEYSIEYLRTQIFAHQLRLVCSEE